LQTRRRKQSRYFYGNCGENDEAVSGSQHLLGGLESEETAVNHGGELPNVQLPGNGEQLPIDGEQLSDDGEQLPDQLPGDGEQLRTW